MVSKKKVKKKLLNADINKFIIISIELHSVYLQDLFRKFRRREYRDHLTVI
jgi:hypothetical protein